jgi:hypothetical protein
MPQAPQYKKPTAAEIRKASKRLAPNINETFIYKGKKISAWVKDKTKPITTRSGIIGYQKKLHPEFRKQKKLAKTKGKKVQSTAPVGIDPSKDKPTTKRPFRRTRPLKVVGDKTSTSRPFGDPEKTLRKGTVTVGTDISKFKVPPRKPPAPARPSTTTTTPTRSYTPDAVPPTASGVGHGSSVDPVRNTRAMNAARAAEAAKTKQRWPGAMQRRVSTKDKGVLETGMSLEGKPVERTELQKHQHRQILNKLVEKFGGSIRDYWNAAKNKPMTEAEAKAKKAIEEGTRKRKVGEYSLVDTLVEYRGGQLKKKKKKKKPTSRRVKSKNSGYGNKVVSSYYD